MGNSYTQRNDLPGLLAALGAAASPPREISSRRVIANGASLRQHWNAGEAARLLREELGDAVVLQEQSTLPIKNRGRYHENVRLFHDIIRERGARTVLYLTWARRAAPETQELLNAAVMEIARETGALVVPAGPAWERAGRTEGAPELYDPDGSHPSLAGSYLAACAFYASLLGRSPEGLPLPPNAPWNPEQTRLLQKAAWRAVEELDAGAVLPGRELGESGVL